jgi:SAM-dependent methyltransferase
MTPYRDLPNPDLLERLPLTARTVLDVGCGTGSLGALYRRLNPRARLLGIDKELTVAEIAAERLDEVVVGDVEIDPLPFKLDAPLDCIVYGDVLEHLREPWTLLREHGDALSREGTMLICVPNIEHWSFAARLLRGNWDYEPEGLLDETHLRWFSLETMRRGLLRLNLVPCDVHPRIFHADQLDAFLKAIAPALASLNIGADAYARRAAPLQYVWRVRKEPRMVMHVAATMLRPVGGVSHVRIVHPLRAMATDPAVRTQITGFADSRPSGGEYPKIFLMHRPILAGAEGLRILRSVLDDGYVVVTEFDDHPAYFEAMQGGAQYAFRGVHAVQTTTPVLADIFRTQNPEVAMFPNAVNALSEPANFQDPKHLTLFFGALNREQDWKPMIPALNSVAATLGERLRFSIVHDQAIFDALETPHKVFTPTCDYESYLQLLGAAEIAFLPLADNEFNRAKSDLKFVEAGACRVAALASPVVYGSSVVDGITAVLFRNGEELRSRLLRLVAMPETARGIGEAARAYVAEKRMLAYQVSPRITWYRSLWERRLELTHALYQRVPELAPARAEIDFANVGP